MQIATREQRVGLDPLSAADNLTSTYRTYRRDADCIEYRDDA
jgi:hypothetical protein